MPRRNVRVKVDEEVMAALIESPEIAFTIMQKAGVKPPNGTKFMFLRLNLRNLSVGFRFHPDEESFVRDYATVIGKGRPGIEPMCYAMTGRKRGGEVWETFLPPPVVGPNVKTRLRAGAVS